MMKVLLMKLAHILVFTCVALAGLGQLKIVPPTPNATKMTEYYAQRPNMYTGTANVSIPLYTIDFDGMSLPISISYNATGIRTNEEASEVGLGWALNATGVISRTVRGFDDFYSGGVGDGRGKGYVYNTTPMPDPFDFGYDQFTTTFPSATSYYAYLVASRPDTEPDVFNYNFFGYSGQFILSQKEKDPNDRVIRAIKLTEDATSIIFNETPNKTFTIITPDGYRGEFTAKELSTSMSGTREASSDVLACGEDKINFLYLLNESGQFRVISSWYLTKITSPRGQEIDFNYDLNANGNSLYLSHNRTFGEDEGAAQNPICLHSIHENVYLRDIVYNDNVKIQFLMEEREDMRKNELFNPSSIAVNLFPYSQNLKRYIGISIIGLDPSSTLNKSITFSQNYFNQQYHNRNVNNENELAWLRSRLDRVTIDDQEYRFIYYAGRKGLPNKQTRAIDHFGFYNGKDANKHLFYPFPDECVCAGDCSVDPTVPEVIYHYRQQSDRLVDFNFGQAGLLKQVIYPTKGYTSFEYESHTYVPETVNGMTEIGSSGGIGGGARVKSIKEFDFDGRLVRSRAYRYTLNGEIDLINPVPSTGRLMTQLLNRGKQPLFIFGDPANGQPGVRYQCNWLIEPNTSIPGNNAAEGKIIGYSVVHEIVEGTDGVYKNSYFFENEPNKILTSLLAVDGQPNINGQIRELRNYNSDGKIVQRTENSGYKDIQLKPGKGVAYRASIINNTYLNYRQDFDIKRTFATPTMVKTTTASTPSGVVENLTTGEIVTWGSTLETRKDLTYSSKYLLESEQTTNSKGEVIKFEYRRPSYYTAPSSTLESMVAKNIIEPVIEEITTKNGSVISATGNRYELQPNSKINLTSSYSYNKALGPFAPSPDGYTFSIPYEKRAEYTSYDPVSGKLLEYKGPDEIVNSFVWGYNNKLPVIHGVGLNFTQLNAAHVAATGSADYETTLRNHPNLVSKQATTYTHVPQIGVAKVTDPSGLKRTFQYDSFGRLKKVLDNDGYTLEQYDYNFKYRPSTRILTISGDLNFGTLTPDMFAPQFIPYVRCSDTLLTKTLRISNTGEYDLNVTGFDLPTGYSSPWSGEPIAPGTSVDVPISFTFYSGSPSGFVSISSDQTSGPAVVQIPVTVNYVNRICSVTLSPVTGTTPKIYDFGTVTGGAYGRILNIKNEGNAPFRVLALPLDWDGVSQHYGNFTSPDFVVGTTGGMCIGPGETGSITLNFTPQVGPNGIRSTKLSIVTDIDPAICPYLKDIVTLQGNIQRPQSMINVDTSPIDFGNFTEAFKTKPLTITNTGDLGFNVTGISVADGSVSSWFTLSPSNWVLNPGATKDFVLTFQPAVKDVTANTTVTINNDAMYGNETIAVTGRRYSLRKMVLDTEPSNILVFNNQHDTKTITITNASISNDNLSVNDVSPPNANLLGWAVTSFTPNVLTPGQSMTMQIMRTGAIAPDQTITIGSTKNDGINSFTLKGTTRTISLTTSPSTTLPAFSTPSISQNITVSNSGTGPLTVGSITSTNAMFTVSPSTVTVAANSQQTVTVTFTPVAFNFSQQTTTLTFGSDATNAINGMTTINIIGQRTSLRTIQVSPSALTFDYTGQQQSVSVSNVGNDYLSVTGVTYPSTPNWSASVTSANLAPGQSTTLNIIRLVGTPENINFTVTSTRNGGNEVVSAVANTRTISLSGPTFSSFTGATSSQNLTISNSGNSTLSVTSISSSNPKFTVSSAPFTVAPGSSVARTVTYTPTDFTSQSVTLTVSSNATNSTGTTTQSASAQRTQLTQLSLSTTILSVKPWDQTPSAYLTNTGNVAVTINGPGSNSNTSSFSIAHQTYNGVIFVNAAFPVTLQPGQQMKIVASSANGSFSSANGTLTIFTTNAGSYLINLVRSTF